MLLLTPPTSSQGLGTNRRRMTMPRTPIPWRAEMRWGGVCTLLLTPPTSSQGLDTNRRCVTMPRTPIPWRAEMRWGGMCMLLLTPPTLPRSGYKSATHDYAPKPDTLAGRNETGRRAHVAPDLTNLLTRSGYKSTTLAYAPNPNTLARRNETGRRAHVASDPTNLLPRSGYKSTTHDYALNPDTLAGRNETGSAHTLLLTPPTSSQGLDTNRRRMTNTCDASQTAWSPDLSTCDASESCLATRPRHM